MEPIVRGIQIFINLYILLIVVWAFGSFNPQWRYAGWYRALESVVDPYMSIFRGMRLQVGMFDLSPMIAIFVLSLLQTIAGALAVHMR